MTNEQIQIELRNAANNDLSSLDLSPEAYQALYDANFQEMPYGTAKARDGDPDEWLDEFALPDYKD